MNTRDQLNQYLQGLEKRMRWLAVSKGAAVAAGVHTDKAVGIIMVHSPRDRRGRLSGHGA